MIFECYLLKGEMVRFRTGSVAAAVAMAGAMTLLSSGVANASAAKCQIDNCIEVVGKGLYVGAVNVAEAAGHIRPGYYYAKYIIHGKETWSWTPWYAGGHVIYFPDLSDRNYPNGTIICGGVQRKKVEIDYPDDACVTVHN